MNASKLDNRKNVVQRSIVVHSYFSAINMGNNINIKAWNAYSELCL